MEVLNNEVGKKKKNQMKILELKNMISVMQKMINI